MCFIYKALTNNFPTLVFLCLVSTNTMAVNFKTQKSILQHFVNNNRHICWSETNHQLIFDAETAGTKQTVTVETKPTVTARETVGTKPTVTAETNPTVIAWELESVLTEPTVTAETKPTVIGWEAWEEAWELESVLTEQTVTAETKPTVTAGQKIFSLDWKAFAGSLLYVFFYVTLQVVSILIAIVFFLTLLQKQNKRLAGVL